MRHEDSIEEMKIAIDECLPKRLKNLFAGDEAYTIVQMRLGGLKDGPLLEELAKRGIDCFITIDGNMEYQQRLAWQPFCTVILRCASNRYADLLPLQEALMQAVDQCRPGEIAHVPF